MVREQKARRERGDDPTGSIAHATRAREETNMRLKHDRLIRPSLEHWMRLP